MLLLCCIDPWLSFTPLPPEPLSSNPGSNETRKSKKVAGDDGSGSTGQEDGSRDGADAGGGSGAAGLSLEVQLVGAIRAYLSLKAPHYDMHKAAASVVMHANGIVVPHFTGLDASEGVFNLGGMSSKGCVRSFELSVPCTAYQQLPCVPQLPQGDDVGNLEESMISIKKASSHYGKIVVGVEHTQAGTKLRFNVAMHAAGAEVDWLTNVCIMGSARWVVEVHGDVGARTAGAATVLREVALQPAPPGVATAVRQQLSMADM